MSTINLTDELLSSVQEALQRNDEQAGDAGIGIQYLAAIIGVMLARFPLQDSQRDEVLQQLFQFSQQVMQDHSNAQKSPSSDPAFGIWKPE